ncbi:hypothetical protein [Leptospira noguchii]|uniref:hypothetical protein n=1 Tax=Leptospira noguchii TaxID=28182 RepID=UPI0003064DBA|nr:hypothetical protein [Leptospira noguchii]
MKNSEGIGAKTNNSASRFYGRSGNSVNAYLWVGVQGVVALSLLFAPIFLRRTHVK